MRILYEHPLSPYAQKNKITLLDKGLELEARTPAGIGSGSVLAELERLDPRALDEPERRHRSPSP